MEKIDCIEAHADSRGKIYDLVESENINAVTIVTFNKGAIRGNHFHKFTYQWNYLLKGKIKIVTQIQDEDVVENIMGNGDFILTVPNEKHALVALEDSELLVLTKGPRGGKEYENDTMRLEGSLIPLGAMNKQ